MPRFKRNTRRNVVVGIGLDDNPASGRVNHMSQDTALTLIKVYNALRRHKYHSPEDTSAHTLDQAVFLHYQGKMVSVKALGDILANNMTG